MASRMVLFLALLPFFIHFLKPQQAKSDDAPMPAFAFSWLNDNNNFTAGDTATIKVRVLGNYEAGMYEFPFKPNITVNDKMGNSSFVTGVSLHFEDGWTICFVPIMVGLFNVLITDEHFQVFDSSLHYLVNPGPMYPSGGIVSWGDGFDEFMAGTKSEVWILPKDAYGNNVSSSSEGSMLYNFTVFASKSRGIPADLLNITHKGWNQYGYLIVEFIPATAGILLLHVQIENQTLRGSPLPCTVNPGKMDVYSCTVEWNVETNYFQLFSVMEGFIHRHDQFGNLVSALHEFDIEVMEKGTNLSMPVADLSLKEMQPGVQSFSFSLDEPGSFVLLISDQEKNTLISGMPYDFTVYIGYCDGTNSIVNGTGLNNSVAGETVNFSVFLKDAYMYPSPVELERLQVRIVGESDSLIVPPIIRIKDSMRYSRSFSGRPNHGVARNIASEFDIICKPEKSGAYKIRVFCGNIPLNGGHPFQKEVIPGAVNVTMSGVVKFDQKVPQLTKTKVVVKLVDSNHNPILQEQSKLQLQFPATNRSHVSTEAFSDNNDGTYTAAYIGKEIGAYEICAVHDGEPFMPCPIGVRVHDVDYFPEVRNDTVSVWEDESIAFTVLENDCFPGVNAKIVDYSKPGHGSILQYGDLFQYTPFKGFYGNDSFLYTIADVNENRATGAVNLLVLCRPPQFVSVPSNLEATEDLLSPKFGGFSGFKISYSDMNENISITLGVKSGKVLLSPTQMQFWQPKWNQLLVYKDVDMTGELKLVGCLDMINFALQAIQYLGNENFYGSDTLRISAINRNGRNDVHIPIFVNPINDPPVINIPPFIVLDNLSDGMLIFHSKVDFIADPDLRNFPGNRSSFRIMFSAEVSIGLLSTMLPAELERSTEVKLRSGYQWQPLNTFVTISKHFTVKAKGIRFYGTIDNCNGVMEQLSYHEGAYGAVLTVIVNDLGNHGCYPNCEDKMSVSLFAESTMNILQYAPINSLAAHTLGSVIIIESIMVFILGLLLLFFICKCLFALVHEKKKKKKAKDVELSKIKQYVTEDSPGERKPLTTGYCPLPLLHRGHQVSSKRSIHSSTNAETAALPSMQKKG
ncbi:protein GAMETE EXPRESSED 2 [Andrographis paniculata]|uniref:protein GAMETE EXPRESSED 2 n=1 Tax=Andrographis paniculata TaxID=175694 RepID=UPI0021E70863|nr:protein GAMETE EXPRESSED 2 [Andrographis paniculata]